MKRQCDIIGLTIIGAAVVLGVVQWFMVWQANSSPSVFQSVQSRVLVAVALVAFSGRRANVGFSIATFTRRM